MDEIFETYGPAVLAVIAGCAIIAIASMFIFGDIQHATLAKYIYDTLTSIMQ